MADNTELEVDKAISALVQNAYRRTQDILRQHKKELDILAKGLIEYETLSGDEVQTLLKGKKSARMRKKFPIKNRVKLCQT